MKFRLLRLLAAFYSFFFVMEVLRELLLSTKQWNAFLSDPVDGIVMTLLASLILLAYTITAYTILYYRYQRQVRSVTTIMIITASFLVIGFRYVIEEVIMKAIVGYGNYSDGTTATYYILDNLYYAILYTIFGVSWYFINYAVYKEQRQQQLELENKKTELSFLKAQVNPHFLFNMLNNIYSLINMGSDKALMATDKLSQLLRYSLYESEQMVTLSSEIKAIQDYIALQELRFRESVQTTVTIDPQLEHFKLAPFLLMPLVENSFKHGVVIDPSRPIIIEASPIEGGIVLSVENAIAIRHKDQVGGIGIENLRKRLNLIYGDHQRFEQHMDENNYKVTITILTK